MKLTQSLSMIAGLMLISALTVRPVRAEDDMQKAHDAEVKKEHFNAEASADKKKAHHMRKKAHKMEKMGDMSSAADADKAAAKEDKNARSEMNDAASAAKTERKELNAAKDTK